MNARKKTKLIACAMLRDEVEAALEKTGAGCDTEWIEEGLHANPGKLRGAVQAALDEAEKGGYGRALLAFGACGNMINGLVAHGFELIIPDADDCITLMLYPHRDGKEAGVYYLTGGWARSGKNAWNERAGLAARFGEKKAERILGAMLGGYHALRFVDTGAYDLAEARAACAEDAAALGWGCDVEKGSTQWIERLLTGPWDEKFLRFGPGETVDAYGAMFV